MMKSQREMGFLVYGVGHGPPPIQSKRIAWEQTYILLKHPGKEELRLNSNGMSTDVNNQR